MMEKKSPTPEQAIRRRRIRLVDQQAALSLLKKTVLFAVALYILFGVVFGLTAMKGGDMEPKLSAGDLLLYYRMQDTYVRNDVAVVKKDGASYVGRVIGLPGDTVEITADKSLVINGNRIVETEIFFQTEAFALATQYPLILGEDEYFLLGDQRETAKDSRYFGAVNRVELKGKVITAIRRTDI